MRLIWIFALVFSLSGISHAQDNLVQTIDVQSALKEFGYSPGPIDGVSGPGTLRAVKRFQAATAIPATGELTPALLVNLGIQDVTEVPTATILVIDEGSDVLAEQIGRMDKAELLEYLPVLASRDTKQIDLNFHRPKSIVFIIYSKLPTGTYVSTYASNIIDGKRNRWSSTFPYTVGEDTPTQPLIIINEFETGNTMFLVHQLFVGRKKVAARVTRAHRGG